MFRLLGGLAAAYALLLTAAPPAAAETVNCPLSEVRRSITNAIPGDWFTTPVDSRLTETRVANVGGTPHLLCVYSEAGTILREAPAGQTCVARTGGFECSASGGPPPTPTSEEHAAGAFSVRGTYNFDLDTGAGLGGAQSDFWFEVVRDAESYFGPRNGARIAVMGSSMPSYADCTGAAYSATRVRIEGAGAGAYFCARTSEGRYAQFRIVGSSPGRPRVIQIRHVTWR